MRLDKGVSPGVLETGLIRMQRWTHRMDAPAVHSPERLLDLIEAQRATGSQDLDWSVLLGATYAAVDAEAARTGEIPLLDCCAAMDCRVFSGAHRGPPAWRRLRVLELAPFGLRSFADAEPFWGCVLAAETLLADLRYSVSRELREDLAMLCERPSARVPFGRREFDLLDLAAVSNPPGVANAIRRARLGCVFESAGDLWAAIELREGIVP